MCQSVRVIRRFPSGDLCIDMKPGKERTLTTTTTTEFIASSYSRHILCDWTIYIAFNVTSANVTPTTDSTTVYLSASATTNAGTSSHVEV